MVVTNFRFFTSNQPIRVRVHGVGAIANQYPLLKSVKPRVRRIFVNVLAWEICRKNPIEHHSLPTPRRDRTSLWESCRDQHGNDPLCSAPRWEKTHV